MTEFESYRLVSLSVLNESGNGRIRNWWISKTFILQTFDQHELLLSSCALHFLTEKRKKIFLTSESPENAHFIRFGSILYCLFQFWGIVLCLRPELHIRRNNMDNSEIIFLYTNDNIGCDPSLEPSRRDGSNEGSKCMF